MSILKTLFGIYSPKKVPHVDYYQLMITHYSDVEKETMRRSAMYTNANAVATGFDFERYYERDSNGRFVSKKALAAKKEVEKEKSVVPDISLSRKFAVKVSRTPYTPLVKMEPVALCCGAIMLNDFYDRTKPGSAMDTQKCYTDLVYWKNTAFSMNKGMIMAIINNTQRERYHASFLKAGFQESCSSTNPNHSDMSRIHLYVCLIGKDYKKEEIVSK